jgi:hypothetical protein
MMFCSPGERFIIYRGFGKYNQQSYEYYSVTCSNPNTCIYNKVEAYLTYIL